MILNICARPGCETAFKPKTSRAKYCSPDCSNHASRDTRAAQARQRICQACGTSFTADNPRKRDCGECDTADRKRIDEHDLSFTCVDGEGMSRWCNHECECKQYAPAVGSDGLCVCGHAQNAGTVNGKTVAGHEHVYVLLGCGQNQIQNLDGIPWYQALEFLYGQFQANPRTVMAGFYLGYDFNEILKTLPWDRARKLFTAAGQAERRVMGKNQRMRSLPVHCTAPNGRQWEINMLASKRLQFRPRAGQWVKIPCTESELSGLPGLERTRNLSRFIVNGQIKLRLVRRNSRRWAYVCDTGPFFQSSFLKAINPAKDPEPVVSQAEYDAISEGKDNRSTAVLDDDMRKYNRLENEILARRLTQLNAGFVKAGVRLRKTQWFGPGQAAQEWLRNQESVPKREAIEAALPAWFLDAARKTYYGGWFEIMAHGLIPGPVWEYDINSAYPAIIANLPCLIHGKITRGDNFGKTATMMRRIPALPTGAIRIVHASVRGSDPRIGAMPHRRVDCSILRPQQTSGWYWQHELEAAQRAGLIDQVSYTEWVTYLPAVKCGCDKPLAGVRGLYDGRIRVGSKTPRGKAYKLMYNSMYGKFAQSVAEPLFANPVYASLITAGCRTMILDAIATHPQRANAVVMVATDAVYFTSQHSSLPLSEALGDWGGETHTGLTLFKPGVYWADKAREAIAVGDSPEFKARGVNAKAMGAALADIDSQFAAWPAAWPETWPQVSFPVSFAMRTCKQSLAVDKHIPADRQADIQRHNWRNAGKVTSGNMVTQNSNPADKRDTGHYDSDTGIYWSAPYQALRDKYGKVEESIPYDKTFGSAALIEAGMIAETSVTPDGEIDDLIYGALGTGQFAH